jgi:hypothetical protein
VRTATVDVEVFPAHAEILSAANDPARNPATHGLGIEPILIRGARERKTATLKFTIERSLAVPISFDVALRIDGRTITCGTLYWAEVSTRLQGRNQILGTQGATDFTAVLPTIGPDLNDADVVLTPNPKPIELWPFVDEYWGEEIVIRKVPLRRLDGTEK